MREGRNIIGDEVSVNKFAVCQNGRAYCCKITVRVILMEEELISYETGKFIDDYSLQLAAFVDSLLNYEKDGFSKFIVTSV